MLLLDGRGFVQFFNLQCLVRTGGIERRVQRRINVLTNNRPARSEERLGVEARHAKHATRIIVLLKISRAPFHIPGQRRRWITPHIRLDRVKNLNDRFHFVLLIHALI